jgi:MFS-type transporter involved in bile tolerance (Atg22 family)
MEFETIWLFLETWAFRVDFVNALMNLEGIFDVEVFHVNEC